MLALGVAGWRRSMGATEPGIAFATIIIPTTLALALTRPRAEWIALFPVWPGDNWELSRMIWRVVNLGPAVAFAAATALHHRSRARTRDGLAAS